MRGDAVPAGAGLRGRNPSAWRERLPLIVLALLGCAIASYLALYQLGVVATVWEPLFGNGSQIILHSIVARMLPVPDAGLGAAGYALDVLLGLLGGRERWRTAPWLVVAFGALVGLMGAGSLVLLLVQPLLLHAGCTLCIASALISLSIASLAVREVRAAVEVIG